MDLSLIRHIGCHSMNKTALGLEKIARLAKPVKTNREKELFKSALLEATVYDNGGEVDFVKLARYWNDTLYPAEEHVQVKMKQVNHLRKYMKEHQRSQNMMDTLYAHKNAVGSLKTTLRGTYTGDRGLVDMTLSVPVAHTHRLEEESCLLTTQFVANAIRIISLVQKLSLLLLWFFRWQQWSRLFR